MQCEIRRWQPGDAEALAEIINNKKIQDNLRDGIPFPYTVRDAEEFIAQNIAADRNKSFAFAITYDGRLVGSIGAYRCQNIHFRTAELGYYLDENYWGRGIATSAVVQICDYIFKNSDIVRIFAEPFLYNKASCRVLEKAGFVREGILRQNAQKNGRIIDMVMYSLIKE